MIRSSKPQKLAIYGADGFGREVLQLIKRQPDQWCQPIFLDDNPSKQGQLIDGCRVMTLDDAGIGGYSVVLAVADSRIREMLSAKVVSMAMKCATVVASSAIVSDVAVIGEGAIISDNVIVTANSRIGRFFHANIFSYVAHDCEIGDFVTFGPRVSCNGRVVVEDGAYIGTSAVLRQGTHDSPLMIGKGAVVGMGAIVTKNVQAGTTVVGNPAKPLER